MDYDKIILELLSRIQVLEEKVDTLMAEKTIKEKVQLSTSDIRKYIQELKQTEKDNGGTTIVLVARDIHKRLNLKDRYPIVCNAMRQCMTENDIILFQPQKGKSSTLEIEYKL